MEDKQCKRTKRFSVIFFVNKSKQRYTVKINNIQGYGPYQIKKEELSGDIGKFPPLN